MRRFKILGELGRGGFGRVLRVVEEGSDLVAELALKLLTGASRPAITMRRSPAVG